MTSDNNGARAPTDAPDLLEKALEKSQEVKDKMVDEPELASVVRNSARQMFAGLLPGKE